MTPPIAPKALLTVRFDADQVSPQLSYKLERLLQGAPAPEPDAGTYAGSLYFVPNEQVNLRVIGVGGDDFVSFEIVEAAFISAPLLLQCGPEVPTIYSPPSMFTTEHGDKKAGAVYLLQGKFTPTVEPLADGRRTVYLDWNGNATVIGDNGRWELSCYVTVRIERTGKPVEHRVFSFDPETEIGNPLNPG